MNNNKQIFEIISGLLTDDQKAVLASALAQETPASEVETVEVSAPETTNPYINDDFIIDEDFGKVKKMTIKEVKEMSEKMKPTPRTGVFLSGNGPRPRPSEYGQEEQVDSEGQTFTYNRNKFDGEVTKLDAEHLVLKEDLIEFKDEVKKLVRNFDGAGKYALTMYQPEIAEANGRKDGKVFYRWNGQKTASMLDELAPFIEQAKEMRKAQEANEEGQ